MRAVSTIIQCQTSYLREFLAVGAARFSMCLLLFLSDS